MNRADPRGVLSAVIAPSREVQAPRQETAGSCPSRIVAVGDVDEIIDRLQDLR